MPRVRLKSGKIKKFPYTPAGKKAAKAFAKKTGGKITDKENDAKKTLLARKNNASEDEIRTPMGGVGRQY